MDNSASSRLLNLIPKLEVPHCLVVVASLTMFVDIQTFFLNALVNTQSEELLDRTEEDDTAYSSPTVNAEDTESLCT